jgi:hypothetical protein
MCERRATQKREKEKEICASNRNKKKKYCESSRAVLIHNVIPIRCNANKALTAF